MPTISLKDIPLTNELIGKIVSIKVVPSSAVTGVITYLFQEDSPYSIQVRLHKTHIMAVFKPEELAITY